MHPLAVVISCVNAQNYADEAVKWLLENSDPTLTKIFLLDNGSDIPLTAPDNVNIIRFAQNQGGNAAIPESFKCLSVSGQPAFPYVAYFHCDLMIREKGWDKRVIDAFEADPLLALLGFVGSDQMDELGGRGSGTRLNYLGAFYEGFGQATPAETHGIRLEGLMPAANLDHCSMVFRAECYKQIADSVAYCPTHFYDRALCAECNYRGWHVAYLGISCDHYSGGTAGGAASQNDIILKWLADEGIPHDPVRPDMAAYKTSEDRFWAKYRDELHMVPYFVLSDYRKQYWSHNGFKWVARHEWCSDCKWNWACTKHNGGGGF